MNAEPKVDFNLDIDKAFQRGLKALRKKIANIEVANEEGKTFKKIREKGELLKCNLHQFRKGVSKLEVDNFYVNPVVKITIDLDPLKTAVENLEDYFSKAKILLNLRNCFLDYADMKEKMFWML